MSDKIKATLKQVAEFFEYKSLSEFRTQWMALDDAAKEHISMGIGDGTLNYEK